MYPILLSLSLCVCTLWLRINMFDFVYRLFTPSTSCDYHKLNKISAIFGPGECYPPPFLSHKAIQLFCFAHLPQRCPQLTDCSSYHTALWCRYQAQTAPIQ